MLKTNTKAPSFQLNDKDGKSHSLNDIKTDYTIVYFYPKDNTPGCTVEANTFNDSRSKFKKLNTTIIGISGGDEKSKTKFHEKHNLKILLLSDSDFKVSKAYKSYGKKKFMGREYMGIMRNTFILDKNKKIIKIYEKVNPKTHAEEILQFIKEQ